MLIKSMKWVHSCKRDESIRNSEEHESRCGSVSANGTRALELIKSMKVDEIHSCNRYESIGVASCEHGNRWDP